MITYRSLEGISQERIRQTFNASFSEYSIPMHLDEATFERKLLIENFNPALSVGAFDEDELVGIILHCTDEIHMPQIVYNGGTGVIADYRGQQITRHMYAYILPIIQAAGYNKLLLEVLQDNAPAFHSYKNIGFHTTRNIISFKLEAALEMPVHSSLFHFEKVRELNMDIWKQFMTTTPTWQNGIGTVLRAAAFVDIWTLKQGEQILAYAFFNKKLNRIHQLAVHTQYRRIGLGSLMMAHLSRQYPLPITIINLEDNPIENITFFESLDMHRLVDLYEMEMDI